MFAWTIWCSCVILSVYLQGGTAERIRGNDLQDDYDDDLDGLGTDIWTERNSTRQGKEVPTINSRIPTRIHTANNSSQSRTDVRTDNNSTRSRSDVWTDDNNGSGMDIPIDNNVTRPETDVPTEKVTKPETDIPTLKKVTQPETDAPSDYKVTRPETDVPTALRTKSSKTTASIDDQPTRITTTRFTDIVPSDVCRNSSCPNILTLTTTLPEGGNFTLRCGSASGTAKLWWYRDSAFLQRGVGEVLLDITEANQSYSGSYFCVDERGCCVLEHHVSVYGVPPYAYHLAVMGAVLAVGIPLCVFLSVRQSSRLGRYARMFNERHGEEKQLIW